MPKRSNRSPEEELFFSLNGIRKETDLHQPGRRRLVLRAYKVPVPTTSDEGLASRTIPLPYMDDLDLVEKKANHFKSEPMSFFPNCDRTATIPFPSTPEKPSTSSAFTFPESPEIPEVLSVSTDSESTSTSDDSDDEFASMAPIQSTSTGITATQKRKITRSEYYRQRLNQIKQEQQERRDRWKKKLEIMEKILNK